MGNRIILDKYRTPKSKIFTGRDRGKQIRIDSKIDEIEAECEVVEFVVPDNLYSINPSFLEELFVNVVSKLGEEAFFQKFNFINEGTYNYEKPLKEAIDRIIREKTALD